MGDVPPPVPSSPTEHSAEGGVLSGVAAMLDVLLYVTFFGQNFCLNCWSQGHFVQTMWSQLETRGDVHEEDETSAVTLTLYRCAVAERRQNAGEAFHHWLRAVESKGIRLWSIDRIHPRVELYRIYHSTEQCKNDNPGIYQNLKSFHRKNGPESLSFYKKITNCGSSQRRSDHEGRPHFLYITLKQ